MRTAARSSGSLAVRGCSVDPEIPLSVVDGQIVSDDGQAYDVRESIESIPWVTATQYPPPHQYVIRERCPAVAWSVLDAAIANHPDSYLAYFRGYQRPNRYWDFDGRRYWRTSNAGPGGVTHMLNRCLFSDAEPPRRVDQGAQPIPDWEGPPWELNGSPWPDWYVLGDDGKHHYRADLDPKGQRQRQS